MYDLTDAETFRNLKSWLNEVKQNAPEKVVKVLIGNKLDLCEAVGIGDSIGLNGSIHKGRQVSTAEAEQFAMDHELYFMEASAKSGEKVDEAFNKAAIEIAAMKN